MQSKIRKMASAFGRNSDGGSTSSGDAVSAEGTDRGRAPQSSPGSAAGATKSNGAAVGGIASPGAQPNAKPAAVVPTSDRAVSATAPAPTKDAERLPPTWGNWKGDEV